jgi:hypothetical protein
MTGRWVRQSSPSGVQTWEISSNPKGPDDSIALATALHRANQRANAELIAAQDRAAPFGKNPPPGKLEVLAYDVDDAGRNYAIKWRDHWGKIHVGRRLLVKVEKGKKK